jgi:hypothetical protein
MCSIIKSEENGIEFYTIAATGESGMSQTGLAILCGVARQTLQSMLKTLAEKAPAEILKPWVGKPLTLAERGILEGKSVGKLNIYAADFCAAVIQHYAFAGNKTAQVSLTKFATIGINLWIQGITRWDSTPLDLQNVIVTAQKFLGEYLDRQEAIESKVTNLEELVHQHDGEVVGVAAPLEHRIFHPDGTYFSIRGYASKVKRKLSKKEASDLGHAATKMSRQQGVTRSTNLKIRVMGQLTSTTNQSYHKFSLVHHPQNN